MAVIPADEIEEITMEIREASPAHFLFKIESFSLYAKHGIDRFESGEFVAGDFKWRLIIYPHGHGSKNEGDGHISVYLAMADKTSLPANWEVNAVFSIFLFNQISCNYLYTHGMARRFLAMKSEWGISKFISMKSFEEPSNGYLVDDNCVFGAEVFVIKSQAVIQCQSMIEITSPFKREWRISEFSKLEDLWTSEVFTAGDHKWKIHLYPKGNGDEKGHSVSMYLYSVDTQNFAPHQKVLADFSLCVKNQVKNQHKKRKTSCWFSSSANDWGFSSMIDLADMNCLNEGFVLNDCCIVEVEISVLAKACSLS